MKKDFGAVLSERGLVLIIQLLSNLVLSRFIKPEEFGIMAILTVFVNFSTLIVDSGIGGSLLFKAKVDKLEFSTVFWFNVLISIVLYLILFFCADLISNVFVLSDLSKKIRYISISIILTGFYSIFNTLAIKSRKFNLIAKINVFAVLISSVLSIVLGYFNFGIWALVIQNLSFNIILLFGLVIGISFKPSFKFSIGILREHYLFGINLLLANLVKLVFDSLVNSLIALKFSMAEVGYYFQAKKIIEVPISIITSSLDKIVFSIFARIKHRRRFNFLFRNLYYIIITIILPFSVLISAYSDVIIKLLYGSNWLNVIPVFSILSIGLGPLVIEVFTRNILKSLGSVRKIFFWEIVKRLFTIIVLIIAARVLKFNFVILLLIVCYFCYMIINNKIVFKHINASIKSIIKDSLFVITSSLLFFLFTVIIKLSGFHILSVVFLSIVYILLIFLTQFKRFNKILNSLDFNFDESIVNN